MEPTEFKKGNDPQSSALLVLAALIWGTAFVAQSEGMKYVGGFTFIGVRYLLGGLVLLPVLAVMRRNSLAAESKSSEKEVSAGFRAGVQGGICCGLCLFVATSLQQFGIVHTTVGKSGFITTLYIVIVPILGIFSHKKTGLGLWVSVMLATIGMYLMCINEGFTIGKGDFLIFLCAIAFSFHILIIDYFSPRANGVLISCVQFFTVGVLGSILMLLIEKPEVEEILAAWAPIGYAGILSSGVAYMLQVVAQKKLQPAVASLIMCLESVFSLLAGWLILHEWLSLRELTGCALVFVAIILAQLPSKRKGG